MSRVVLLNLADSDVDVLTHLGQRDPRPEVVVVHQDANALISRLARLAELPETRTAPEARADDMVVATSGSEDLVRAWVRAGATVVSPAELMGTAGDTQDMPAVDPITDDVTVPEEPAPAEESKVAVYIEEPVQPPPPTRLVEPKPEPAAANSNGAGLPVAALATPEATFAFLVEHAGGSDPTLWWDGKVGLWTPWIGATSEIHDKPAGLAVDTAWGDFVVSGRDVTDWSWDKVALKRVLEDIALRDLMEWNALVQDRPQLANPAEAGGLQAWLEAAAAVIKPEAALAWTVENGRWSLVSAYGAGVVFSGSLRLEPNLLDDLMSSWQVQPLGTGTRVFWKTPAGRARSALRLRRLERLCEGAAV